MDYELTRKWPFNDSCADHVNVKDMEHVERGKEHTKKKLLVLIDQYFV